ncbi:MAG: IS66 family transposase [Kofleriaceae bacterium]|nr:IS66 family transposase [Myxococcales bacterium]MCB9560989.1 IS66 family transposase [Kofleriaceae bacterium]MCB9563168.1 IS66 family transposase [Kofleriaceae bacterium]MCB9574279.1 IS66 family transposase [Kofleriaceae bacterium]
MATVAELRRENEQLRAQLSQLIAEVARLNDRVSELVAVARRRQRPPAPPPAPTPSPSVDAPTARAFADRPAPPPLPDKPKRAAKPRRPTGRKPLPAHLEAETHELRADACAHCGSHALDAADVVVEEKLHVVKEHQRRRVVRRTTCRCRDCGQRTTPRSLPAPYERSKVTCDWLAWFVDQKFGLLTPLDRIRRDLASRGIPLAMGSLVAFIERAADLLAPVDGHHWRTLLAGRWMATDGTGLKVLVPKLPAAHNGYVELYRNRDVAVFQYEPDKAAEGVVAKLQPFRGTLTADAEHRFNAVYATGRVVEAGCNAHGRRKFRDAEATRPDLAAEGGAFIAAMYVAEQDAQARGLLGAKLLAHRRKKIRPIAADFRRWRAAVEPTLLPSEPLATAVGYYQRHGDALFRFLDDPDVPIDNSPTEREFQHVAKLRLNVLFAGSTEGAHRACVLLGIVATCRAVGVPIQAYLTWAFERLGTHRDAFALPVEQLTPAAFKRARR